MHEGFVRALDTPEMRRLDLVGSYGRARGIRVRQGTASTVYYPSARPTQAYRVACQSLTNTCTCWPTSKMRCRHCRDI